MWLSYLYSDFYHGKDCIKKILLKYWNVNLCNLYFFLRLHNFDIRLKKLIAGQYLLYNEWINKWINHNQLAWLADMWSIWIKNASYFPLKKMRKRSYRYLIFTLHDVSARPISMFFFTQIDFYLIVLLLFLLSERSRGWTLGLNKFNNYIYNFYFSKPWKPDLDSWEVDLHGMYGLKLQYLRSLGITPPLDKWVHVSNVSIEKLYQ